MSLRYLRGHVIKGEYIAYWMQIVCRDAGAKEPAARAVTHPYEWHGDLVHHDPHKKTLVLYVLHGLLKLNVVNHPYYTDSSPLPMLTL